MDTSQIDIITTGLEDQAGLASPKPNLIAEVITRHIPFAKDESRNLFYYHEGVYHPNGEEVVRELIIRILKTWSKLGEWNTRLEHNVINRVRIGIPTLWNRPPLERINLLNGVFDLAKDTFYPHTTEWLSSVQIPITYDPLAVSHYWVSFLDSIFPEGVELLLEMIGWFMVPHTRLQKAVLLLGKGSNGKGTFTRMLDKIIGDRNTSHVSLHQLEDERFSRGMIVGKLINSCGDLPVSKIKSVNLLKTLTGEDAIQIEYKGCQPFSYKPFCRLLFSSNKLPEVDDDTEGYKRRWLIIPFAQTFDVNPQVGRELESNLSTPEELSGLLNLIIPNMLKVIDSGFTITQEIAEVISNYSPLPNNVKEYFDRYLELNENGIIPSEILYKHYLNLLRGVPNKEEGYTRHGLVTYIKNHYPQVGINIQKWFDGKNERCYTGITFKPQPKVVEFPGGGGYKIVN